MIYIHHMVTYYKLLDSNYNVVGEAKTLQEAQKLRNKLLTPHI